MRVFRLLFFALCNKQNKRERKQGKRNTPHRLLHRTRRAMLHIQYFGLCSAPYSTLQNIQPSSSPPTHPPSRPSCSPAPPILARKPPFYPETPLFPSAQAAALTRTFHTVLPRSTAGAAAGPSSPAAAA